eukprot:6335262-Amphidinium_carterae.1
MSRNTCRHNRPEGVHKQEVTQKSAQVPAMVTGETTLAGGLQDTGKHECKCRWATVLTARGN